MSSIERSFYLLNNRTIYVVFHYNKTHCIDGFRSLLQRLVRKSNDAKEPNNSQLLFVTERTQLNATHAQKIETDCFSTNLPISNDPVVSISRHLAKKIEQRSITKSLNFDIFNNTRND